MLIMHGFVEIGRVNPKKELVQLRGIPPAVHVGFPESKRTFT
jgi:hypothetical protein